MELKTRFEKILDWQRNKPVVYLQRMTDKLLFVHGAIYSSHVATNQHSLVLPLGPVQVIV